MRWTKEQYEEYTERISQTKLRQEGNLFQGDDAKDYPADKGPESGLQAKVINYCKEQGWPIFHDRSKKVNEPGWADNFIFLPKGKMVLIELKSSSGKLRKEQIELRLALKWLDHEVHVAKSFKAVMAILHSEINKEKTGQQEKGI